MTVLIRFGEYKAVRRGACFDIYKGDEKIGYAATELAAEERLVLNVNYFVRSASIMLSG